MTRKEAAMQYKEMLLEGIAQNKEMIDELIEKPKTKIKVRRML